MDKEYVIYIYVCVYIYLLSYIKEQNNAIFSNMDRSGDNHIKKSNPDRERQISQDITYKWNLKK